MGEQLEAGVYLHPLPDERMAELIVVALDGSAMAHKLSIEEMRQMGSRLHAEAARLSKHKPPTLKHIPIVVDGGRLVKP